MATYRQVKGYSIKSVSSNPDNIKEGQIWYNSTELKLKVAPFLRSFSSGGNLNTARHQVAGSGPQTAALAFAGNIGPPFSNASEQYDGTSWTNTPNINTTRTIAGGSPSGTYTAAIAHGGQTGGNGTTVNNTELWNGSSWTEVNNLNTARSMGGAAGTSTSAFGFGGDTSGIGTNTNASEEWNGTNWTNTPSLNDDGSYIAGCGSNGDDALAIDGNGRSSTVEEWNGSSWTEVADTTVDAQSRTAFGTTSAATICGGNYINTVEDWDGTSWTTNPASLANTRGQLGGSGSSSTNGLVYGGYNPPSGNSNKTEEYNFGALARSVDVS